MVEKRVHVRRFELTARRVDASEYDDLCEIVAWCNGRAVGHDGHLIAIDTPAGEMYADDGDWIIREPSPTGDRFYPCTPEVFAAIESTS